MQVLAEHLPAMPLPDLAEKIRFLQDTLQPDLASKAQPSTVAAAISLLDDIHRSDEGLMAWLPADIDIDGELYYWAQAFDRQVSASWR